MSAVFLDDKHNVISYTSDAVRIFNIIDQDIGRPISHVSHQLKSLDIASKCKEVVEKREAFEIELVVDKLGKYLVRVAPHVNSSTVLLGTVILLRR